MLTTLCKYFFPKLTIFLFVWLYFFFPLQYLIVYFTKAFICQNICWKLLLQSIVIRQPFYNHCFLIGSYNHIWYLMNLLNNSTVRQTVWSLGIVLALFSGTFCGSWNVLCMAKTHTQWPFWVPSNSDCSVILW